VSEGIDGQVRAVPIGAGGESRLDVVEVAAARSATLGARTDPNTPSPRAPRGWPLPDRSALVAIARLWSEAHAQLAEDTASLLHTYGERWPQVPRHHGVLASQAKEILASGIVPVRPETADPVRVLQDLDPFVKFTSESAQQLLEHASLLGEALGSDLSGLTLGNLRRLCHAIFRLSDAPPPNPAWCRPAAAYAASVALGALGDDMRAATALYQQLYEDFTEEIWDLPSIRRHSAVDRWWQAAARRRLKAELASVSRTGRPPTNVRATMATLRRALALRKDIEVAWTSMRGHLGWFADAPMPDVEGASASLAAVQELLAALGERADVARLMDLAAADAFVCAELSGPASEITDTIAAWAGLAKRFHGPDPLAFTAPELSQWAVVTAQSLEVLRVLKEATAPLRPRIRSVAEIFDDAVARDRVEQLRAVLGLDPIAPLEPAGTVDKGDQR